MIHTTADLPSLKTADLEPLIKRAWDATVTLRKTPENVMQAMLDAWARVIEANTDLLLEANAEDVARQDQQDPKTDRLLLNAKRLQGICSSIRQISKLPNPSGRILERRTLPNGLQLEKQSVPLGLVAAIYESRPNVTFDIAALCLRSLNGCLLKGSREAEQTNVASVQLLKKVLNDHGIPGDSVMLLPADRESVQQLFHATKYVDVIIPRGSDNLIRFVRENSLVPVIETGAGVCHVYVEGQAAIDRAVQIVVNAKVSRPSVCNAMDTVLVDEVVAKPFLQKLQAAFRPYQVEVFADPQSHEWLTGYPHLYRASPQDFGREFLSLKCAVKVVKDIDEALSHIREFSTKHSEAIVSEDTAACERFLQEVDAAAVYTNASTRFTDGEEFGLGAEIGISTQKLHARGPFALEKLVTEKWIIRGSGQVREG